MDEQSGDVTPTGQGEPSVAAGQPLARQRSGALGKIGFYFALLPPLGLLLTLVLQPGPGDPTATLGASLLFYPVLPALVISIIGVIKDSSRKHAIAGMVLSGLFVLYFLVGLAAVWH